MKKKKNILKNRLVIASLFFSISIFIMIIVDTNDFSMSGLVNSIIFAAFAGSVIFILNYPSKSK